MRLYPVLIAVACLATPAVGQSVAEIRRTENVSLAGVRLQDPQSLAELNRRIDKAVRRVCAPDGATLHHYMSARACRGEARKGADAQLARLVGETKLATNQRR